MKKLMISQIDSVIGFESTFITPVGVQSEPLEEGSPTVVKEGEHNFYRAVLVYKLQNF
jgi:hypothetical protein